MTDFLKGLGIGMEHIPNAFECLPRNAYENGYRDGMQHMATQMHHMNEQMGRMSDLLHRALFVQEAGSYPRPGVNLWLILDGGIVTTGYFMDGRYVADSGAVVSPTHWCMIPPAVSGSVNRGRRRILPRIRKGE